jgi:hypothetical protein
MKLKTRLSTGPLLPVNMPKFDAHFCYEHFGINPPPLNINDVHWSLTIVWPIEHWCHNLWIARTSHLPIIIIMHAISSPDSQSSNTLKVKFWFHFPIHRNSRGNTLYHRSWTPLINSMKKHSACIANHTIFSTCSLAIHHGT